MQDERVNLQEGLNRKCGDDAVHAFGTVTEGQAMVIQELVAERLGCPDHLAALRRLLIGTDTDTGGPGGAPQRCRQECRVFIGWEPPI